MAKGDGSRFTRATVIPLPLSRGCDWTRCRAAIRRTAGRRAGNRMFAAQRDSTRAIQLGFSRQARWKYRSRYAGNGTKIALKRAPTACMTPPEMPPNRDIDLGFRVPKRPLTSPAVPSYPTTRTISPRRPYLFQSLQLALVIGLFASGGLICSILLFDSSDEVTTPRYWPREIYSSPAGRTPHRPMAVPVLRQNEAPKPNSNLEDKTAVLQERRIGDSIPFHGPSGWTSPLTSFTTG